MSHRSVTRVRRFGHRKPLLADQIHLASAGGLRRTSSGLLTVRGTTANPWATDDVTASSGTVALLSGRLDWDPGGGTGWPVLEWNDSPDRTKRYLQVVCRGDHASTVWIGWGVGDAAVADGLFARCSINRSPEWFGDILQTDNEAVTAVGGSNGLPAAKNENVDYRFMTKVDDDGASGLDVTTRDITGALTAGPHGNTLLGTSAKAAFFTAEGNQDPLFGECHDMADWVITVNGLASGEILRIVDGGESQVVSVTGGGSGVDTIDLSTAWVDITTLVKGLHRNAADDETLSELTPTGGPFGESGFFGGDVLSV